jgi:hypothetical protein
MNTQTETRRITKATFKGFVNRNRERLYIKVKREFDGMIDGCRDCKADFEPMQPAGMADHTLGIKGVWLVGDGRDYFSPYDDDVMTGLQVSNCCGSFIVAIKK